MAVSAAVVRGGAHLRSMIEARSVSKKWRAESLSKRRDGWCVLWARSCTVEQTVGLASRVTMILEAEQNESLLVYK
jgi:hypothetical protein